MFNAYTQQYFVSLHSIESRMESRSSVYFIYPFFVGTRPTIFISNVHASIIDLLLQLHGIVAYAVTASKDFQLSLIIVYVKFPWEFVYYTNSCCSVIILQNPQ